MPVTYTDDSAGPSTRAAGDVIVHEDPKQDLSGMTKAELVDLAKTQGVSAAGNKADLIKRLS